MDKNINIKVKVWRQRGPEVKGAFETYDLQNISQGSSFLEMLDILNEQLVREGKEPVVFDHDCREGSCTCVASTMATRSPSSLGVRQASPSSVT